MGNVIVHPRVAERHPELAEDDVRCAWNNYIRMSRRAGDDNQVIAMGFDKRGRAIEMVAKESAGDYLVYHALTPPTEALLMELGLVGR